MINSDSSKSRLHLFSDSRTEQTTRRKHHAPQLWRISHSSTPNHHSMGDRAHSSPEPLQPEPPPPKAAPPPVQPPEEKISCTPCLCSK
ncbi:hypothetical protein V6N13_038214 [Hibiscus sabdariffa]